MAAKDASGGPMDEWARKMQTIMDEMRSRSFCDYRPRGTWEPSVNVYAIRTSYHVCIPLAGVDAQDIVVECPGPQQLCVRGQRTRPALPSAGEPFSIEIMEIDEGAFHREISLPEPVDAASVQVRHERGYIWITLQKIQIP